MLDEVQRKHSKLTVYMGQSALAGGVLQECTPTSDVMRLCEPEAQRGANGQPLQRSPVANMRIQKGEHAFLRYVVVYIDELDLFTIRGNDWSRSISS